MHPAVAAVAATAATRLAGNDRWQEAITATPPPPCTYPRRDGPPSGPLSTTSSVAPFFFPYSSEKNDPCLHRLDGARSRLGQQSSPGCDLFFAEEATSSFIAAAEEEDAEAPRKKKPRGPGAEDRIGGAFSGDSRTFYESLEKESIGPSKKKKVGEKDEEDEKACRGVNGCNNKNCRGSGSDGSGPQLRTAQAAHRQSVAQSDRSLDGLMGGQSGLLEKDQIDIPKALLTRRCVFLTGTVDDESISKVMKELLVLDALNRCECEKRDKEKKENDRVSSGSGSSSSDSSKKISGNAKKCKREEEESAASAIEEEKEENGSRKNNRKKCTHHLCGVCDDAGKGENINLPALPAPITLFISSGGGQCAAGFCLVDVVNAIQSPVSTVVLGRASSMAAVIAAAGTGGRYVTRHSRLMIHDPSCAPGKMMALDLERRASELTRTRLVILQMLALSTGRSVSELEPFTAKDSYFTAEEAVAFGLADYIIG